MRTMKRAWWLALVPALVTPVFASSEGGAGNPFAGDIGNALWTVVIFVVVLIVLGKFAWGPILNALQKREQFIHDSLAQAKKDREAAEAALKEYEQKLHEAKAEATAIVEEGRRDADEVRRREEARAKEEAEAMLQRARREITVATETAVSELYSLSSRLATDVASRVIRKELTGSDHERLIAEAIDEFKSVNN